MGVQKTRSQVLQIIAFQDGCGATQNCQSQLGNGFQGICCQGCMFPLTSLSSMCLRSSRLFTSCVSAAFLRISPDLIFLSFLFFFDKQPAACSLPIHFIHILFPCKNSCLLALGSAPSQHKQLLRIRSDYPTDQKSRRAQAAPRALALAALAAAAAALG